MRLDDVTMGRFPKRVAPTLDMRPTTPLRARQLAFVSVTAAGYLVFDHAISILLAMASPTHALIGGSAAVMWANAAGLLTALYLAVRLHRSKPPWAAVVVAGWCLLECFSFLTFRLYGHVAFPSASGLAFAGALAGVRGAFALRRFEASA